MFDHLFEPRPLYDYINSQYIAGKENFVLIDEVQMCANFEKQFVQRALRYTTLTELTPYALRELVKAICVEVSDKSSGKRKQKVYIEYDLVGYIFVDELIKEEQA